MEKFKPNQEFSRLLSFVISAHQDFINDHENPEKLEVFKNVWNKALELAKSDEEMSELFRHAPNDEVGSTNSRARETLLTMWDKISDEEISNATSVEELLHAYNEAPFDPNNFHRNKALLKLLSQANENNANKLHDYAVPGSELAFALEKKFPSLMQRISLKKDEDISTTGIDDMTDEDSERFQDDGEKDTE